VQAQEGPIIVNIVGTAPTGGLQLAPGMLPYSVQSVTDKALQAAQADNLVDYMSRNLNGVNTNDIAGGSLQTDLTFRGFRASPVLGTAQGVAVYFDGVRINEPLGDVVNWDMLPEGAIAGALLVGGSNPSYGLNALGGALAITSKSGRSHPGSEAGFSTSSLGRRKVELSSGAVLGDGWDRFVAATLFDDTGWRDQSPGRLANVFVKIGHTAGPLAWNWSVLAGRSRLSGNGLLPSYRWSEVGLQPGLYERSPTAVYTYPDRSDNTLIHTALNARLDLAGGGTLALNAYLRGSRRNTVNGDVSDDYLGDLAQCAAGLCDPASAAASLNTTATRQHGEGLSVDLNSTHGSHQYSGGAAVARSAIRYGQFERTAMFSDQRAVVADAAAEPELTAAVSGTTRTASLYGSDSWTISGTSVLTASLRLNREAVANVLDQQEYERFRYVHLNPSLGIAQGLTPRLTAFANLSQNNRAPTAMELGCANPEKPCRLPVGLQSDPFLKQVVSNTAEAGLRWQGHGAALSAALYRTNNRDDILFQSAGRSAGYFANVDRTRHQGLDLAASGRAGPVALHFAYSLLDASYQAPAWLFTGARNVLVTKGTPIAGLPRHTLKLSADWPVSAAWAIGADAQALSSLPSRGNEDGLHNDWSIRGYALLNLRSSYRFTPQSELSFGVRNALNRRYETYGAVAGDVFPGGQLQRPRDGMAPVALARFVAPGAPRSLAMTWHIHY
jgi:outer membrane receptor protein involved in Fe transport